MSLLISQQKVNIILKQNNIFCTVVSGLKTKTDKCSVHVYTLYCSAPFPHTVPPPEIMTNRCSFSTAPHQLLTQCLLLKSQLTSVQCVYTLLLYLKLPSHTVLIPEVTTDKCSVHVHSAAPLHTAFSCSISWTQNRQMFIACALYCSTLHRFLTQPLLNSQQTSVQCMHTLLLHLTPHYATSVSTHTHTHTHKYIHKYAHGHIHTQIHAHHTHKHLVVVT